MRTWVSDSFPLKKLECQYFDICKEYDSGRCDFTNPCELRQWFREVTEPYVGRINLKVQVDLIRDENKR